MIKNKLKFKINFKKTILFFYKARLVLFVALFVGLLLIAFNVCYNETYLKIAIPEINNASDNYIRVEKTKLKKIIGEIERKENNANKEISKEYRNPFDVIEKNEPSGLNNLGNEIAPLPISR